MITLKNVQLTLGGQRLFDGLDWQLARGQRVGLVGPNGAGKSTLLKLLAASIEPEKGEVEVPSNLSIGYLPQEVLLSADDTPWEIATSVFSHLKAIQSQIQSLSEKLEQATGVQSVNLLEALERLQVRYELEGGYQYEVDTATVLSGLGIAVKQFHRPMSSFSGGWRARVYLARVLLAKPDVFLLDEPTNHLDIEALEWLTNFLLDRDPTMIVVSHDRWFLNRICTHVAELSEQGLYVVRGNFDQYVGGLDERARQLDIAQKKHAAQVSKLSRFIERFGAKASKAKQAKSKMKKLEKLGDIRKSPSEKTVHFQLPPAAPSDRVLLELKDVGFGYGSHQVLNGANAVITKGTRIGIVGVNGAGKSTLVNLICGHLEPTLGRIERSDRTRPFLFEQHQIDALDPSHTAVQSIEDSAATTVTQLQIRNALGAFGLGGDDVFKRVEVLSGGEKARVALTKALMRPVNLVVLDEPTNHLDMPSKLLLEEALQDYDGTLVVISHDRQFLNQICTQIWAIQGGCLSQSLGNYDDYQRGGPKQHNAEQREQDSSQRNAEPKLLNQKERRRQEAIIRKAEQQKLKPLQQELSQVESTLNMVGTELEHLEAEQLRPDHHQNVQRMLQVAKLIEDLREREALLYETYGQLVDQIDAVKAASPS